MEPFKELSCCLFPFARLTLILLLPRFISEYGCLLTGKAFSLSHVSSNINMVSEIRTLMNPSEILRDVE